MNRMMERTSSPGPGSSEARFRNIFEHCNDSIFVMDPAADRILDANPKACRMLGYSLDELLTMPISAIHPDEMPVLMQFAQTVADQGAGWTDRLSCLTKSGQRLAAEISASNLTLGNRPCLIAMVRDLSERRSMEQALRAIVEGTATVTGAAFFRSLVRELATTLGARYAFVAEAIADKRVRTLAYWEAGHFGDN